MRHFIADTHFGHDLTRSRGFAHEDEHDDTLIENINKYVAWNDQLYILGDFAWRSADKFAKRITCQNKHLIWGNHDKNSFSSQFKTVDDVAEVRLGADRQKCWLSHYAHFYWPASHNGSFHLYGHNHGDYEALLDGMFPDRRSMDVGVDVAIKLLGEARPFTEDWILERLSVRPGHHPAIGRHRRPSIAKDDPQ